MILAKRAVVLVSVAVLATGAALGWLAMEGGDDTEETLYPEPSARTAFRLRQLQVGIQKYVRAHGELPDSIPQALATLATRRGEPKLRSDAWGAPLAYTRTGTAYELRSPGPDGQGGTEDDIVLSSSLQEVLP